MSNPLHFLVQRRMCATCIYRHDSNLDLARLEAAVADPQCPGFFRGYRICHHASTRSRVCCAGFWRRHKHRFTLGQLAQRLRLVRFVVVDTLTQRRGAAKKVPRGDQ